MIGCSAGKRDERAPLLSNAQWSSLARALSIEEIQAMVVVGDAPFVSDSILDARAKARHPSNVRVAKYQCGVCMCARLEDFLEVYG